MRLVWVVIPLVLIGIIGMQESFAEESSLKQQLAENVSLLEILCPDENHVLSKRSNDKLACVTPYAVAKLQLNPVDNSFWSIVVKNEQRYGIFTHLSKTENVESVKYNQDMNSIIIHVISDKSEKLSVNVNREILESGNETCPQMPPWDDYFVLINGEEVAYEKRLTTDHYRYLELEIYPYQKIASQILPYINDIHKLHSIPFDEDSMIIEIIGTCLT